MATKSPLHKLQDTVVGTVKAAFADPVGTAGKAVEQARGTVSLGRSVAGQVGKSAVGAVTSRLGHHGTVPAPRQEEAATTLRSVPPVKKAPPKKTPTKAPVTDVATPLVKEQAARPAADNAIDAAADPTHVEATPADVAKTVAKRAPAKKATRKAPAKKAAASTAPATKSTPSAKLPPRKPAADPAPASTDGD